MTETLTQMQLLDGKKVAKEVRAEIRVEVDKFIARGYRAPHLVAILVGDNTASHTYVRNKIKACKEVGIKDTLCQFEDSLTEEALLAKLAELNADPGVDGILVQLPLPKHINADKVLEAIVPDKDVDGFHPINIGRMAKNLPAPLPATPAGIMELIRRYKIPTRGKHCVVVGRSNIVGSPISILMSRPGDSTVTLTHRHTPNLGEMTRQADILVVAVGKPGLITADMVKDGVAIIDVGINAIDDSSRKRGYRLVGDIDFETVSPKCSYLTPVPGGVGPMTIAMLLKNTLWVYLKHEGIPQQDWGIDVDFFAAFSQHHSKV